MYRLIGKASVRTNTLAVQHGDTITDEQYSTLDATRQAYFRKVPEKKPAARKAKKRSE